MVKLLEIILKDSYSWDFLAPSKTIKMFEGNPVIICQKMVYVGYTDNELDLM